MELQEAIEPEVNKEPRIAISVRDMTVNEMAILLLGTETPLFLKEAVAHILLKYLKEGLSNVKGGEEGDAEQLAEVLTEIEELGSEQRHRAIGMFYISAEPVLEKYGLRDWR